MLEMIIYNLQMIGCAMLLLAGAWLANMILGLFYNTVISTEHFDKKKLVAGIMKLTAVCIGTALASVVITLFPVYLTKYGIGIQDEAIETFSVIVIAGIYAVAIIKYLKECIGKLTDILK